MDAPTQRIPEHRATVAMVRKKLRIRREEQRPACAVQGCREYPGVNLCNRRFCSGHAGEFRRILSERTWEAFLQILRDNRIHGEPKLYAQSADHAFRPHEHQCSVPGCPNEGANASGPGWGPKSDEWLVLCGSHFGFNNQVMEQRVPERLLWEWESRRRPRSDKPRERMPGIRGRGQEERYAPAERILKQEMTKHLKEYPDIRERYFFVRKTYVYKACIKNYDGMDNEDDRKTEEKKVNQALLRRNLGPPHKRCKVLPSRLSR